MNSTYSCYDLLNQLIETNGTDLLLCVGQKPQIRVDKKLVSLEYEPLTHEDTAKLCFEVMSKEQQKAVDIIGEYDFSFGVSQKARFRANVFRQRGTISGAFRRIAFTIPSFEQLDLPRIVRDMADMPNGLVLVTGPTGCGKSTTLAAMIDHINHSRYCHIITIEDPIEYLHQHHKSTVDQREVSVDTQSFHTALRGILRQNPDVVLLGEMRDVESIQAALTISETGHLCLSTLHTNSCSQTLARIVDVFPGEKQPQIRTQLSMALNGIISQLLLPRRDGGLQIVLELLVVTPAIRSLIRENKMHAIDNQILLGKKFGMQTLNQSLATVVKSGSVSLADALVVSPDKDDLQKLLYE